MAWGDQEMCRAELLGAALSSPLPRRALASGGGGAGLGGGLIRASPPPPPPPPKPARGPPPPPAPLANPRRAPPPAASRGEGWSALHRQPHSPSIAFHSLLNTSRDLA